MKEIAVGDRVQDLADGHRATVMFIGPVPPTKGAWLGVDWDAGDKRGKHDGSHEGRSYFAASSSKSGSFVRGHKVDGGVTFNAALKDRYGVVEDGTALVDDSTVQDLRKEMKASFVEMVGFEKVNKKQGDFKRLMTVDLSGSKVRGPGGNDDPTLLEAVTDLNLSNTLISRWETVAEICRPLR